MWQPPRFLSRCRYRLLENGWTPEDKVKTGYSPSAVFVFRLFILALVALLAFAGGRHSVEGNRGTSSIELNTIPSVFHYNPSFGGQPTNETNAAWRSLFPAQGGFFKNPTLAPNRSAFAVFHQLHCLDGIRHGYWALYGAARAERKVGDADVASMGSPLHMRHCIDLLRQTLMCQPDLTVEVKDETKGGVTGFGTEHQCKDWGQLVRWTGEWETWMQDRPGKGERQHEHEHEHSLDVS